MTLVHGSETRSPDKGTELEGIRQKVFLDRYSLKDRDGTATERYPEQMWQRVAAGIAAVEPTEKKRKQWAAKFYEALAEFRFVPGGRILAGAGSGHRVTYYNCFEGETPVHTAKGIVPIGSLNGEHDVLSEGGVYRKATFQGYGRQRLWEITLANGATLRATGDHQWVATLPKGGSERVSTRELKGRRIPINPRPAPSYNEDFAAGVRHGIVYGDGSAQYGKAHVCLFDESEHLARWFDDHSTRKVDGTLATKTHIRIQGLPLAWKRELPRADDSASYWRGFVAGLIAADGYVDARGSAQICNKDATVLAQIAEGMAVAGFVASGISLVREMSPYDGSPKPLYRLQFFKSTINSEDLLLPSHRRSFEESPAARQATIQVINVRETDRVEEVFCCVEPETHTITVGHGYLTGQCYVIPSPEDSRGGILDNLKLMTEIMARGGGVGVNLSSIRPRGSYIRSVNGTASGPCSWGQLYSVATGDVIQQGGSRRGALMLMLDDNHPDIEDFITVKRRPGVIEHANLSVCVSDAFMEAVDADADWDLVWDGNVIRTVRARHLWNLICESAWTSAEPGVVFIDRYNKQSNTWYYENIRCVNPCVTGATLVATPGGWMRADEIAAGAEIGTVAGIGRVDRVEVYRQRPVFRVRLSDGATLRVTAAHQFHAIPSQGGKKNVCKHYQQLRLDQLNVGDHVRISPAPMPSNLVPDLPEGWTERDYGFFIGVVLGDGCITPKTVGRDTVKVAVDPDDSGWSDIVVRLLARTGSAVTIDGRGARSINLTTQSRAGAVALVRQSCLVPSFAHEKIVPLIYQQTNEQFLAGLLDGLFSTDGNVNLKGTHPVIRFKTCSETLAQDVRRILLCFGIHGRVVSVQAVDGRIGDRVIHARHPQYEVLISGAGIQAFANRVGFTHPGKRDRLHQAVCEYALTGNTWRAEIVSIEPDGVEDVYDLYEPTTDTWITEGVVSRGCGEQGLPPFGVCNLGALNLAAFVKDGEMDYGLLGEHARIAMRFLDDVVDANDYFIEENRQAQLGTRRTGLGTMGLADALLAMELRYGSDESLAVIERAYETIRDAAYDASCDIAAEKGTFANFDAEKYLQGQFIQRLPEPIRAKIKVSGIRNAVLLTQAPTGTTSLLAGVSSGIEPVYDFAMVRRDRTGEHILYHPLYEQWRKRHPDAPTPDWFVKAADLTPEEHVRVQALVQRYTDSSISKTVNAPNHHRVEEVDRLYRLAYELGCKGITYYRDGSRDAVLTHLEEKKEEKKPAPAAPAPEEVAQLRPRPHLLRGMTYRAPTPVGTAFVTINSDPDGNICEVFITVGRAGSDIAADAEALGRLISLAFRIPSKLSARGVAEAVVDQLSGIGGSTSLGFGNARVRSLADAVAKVLVEHLGTPRSGLAPVATMLPEIAGGANGHAPDHATNGNGHAAIPTRTTGDFCPGCGQIALVNEEGCHKCYVCGFSSC